MSRNYYPVAFTDEVVQAQEHFSSRRAWARRDRRSAGGSAAAGTAPEVADPLTGDERDFLARLDGFFLATVSGTGWPYVQFRGGPPGFIQTPDDHTIAWADFRGNRQYISTGNIAHDDKVALLFLDYPRQLRLKVYGRASITDADNSSPLAKPLDEHDYDAKVEREVRIEVVAYDWNCPQHITPRYSADELAPVLDRLQDEISTLRAENAQLRWDGNKEDF